MARLLPPDSFASMQSLFGVLMIGMMAGLPVRLAVAKTFASGEIDSSKATGFAVSCFYRLRLWILSGFVLSWLVSPTISKILGIQSKIAVFLILLCLLLDLSLQFLQAIFQGTFQFRRLGYLTILNPFFKLSFSVLLLLFASSFLSSDSKSQWVSIPTLGLFLSTLITVMIGLVFLRPFKLSKAQPDVKEAFPNNISILNLDTFLLTALHLSFSLLSQIDIIIANKFLPLSERGSVAIMSIVGKILLYSIGAISPVVFSYRAKGQNSSILKPTLVFTLACGLGGALVALLAGNWIMPLLFGSQYTLNPGMLALWILMYMILSYLMILIMEISATKLKKQILFVPAVVAVMLGALVLFTERTFDIFLILTLGGLVLISGIHLKFDFKNENATR